MKNFLYFFLNSTPIIRIELKNKFYISFIKLNIVDNNMSFDAAPLEQRIYGVDAIVDSRAVEIIKNAEHKVGRYFREVLPKLTNVVYVIKNLPTYVEEGIERTKDGYRRYIKPVKKIMGAYTSELANGVKTIFIDPMVLHPDHILRKGGYLPDGTYVHGMGDVGNPELVLGHEMIHGYREDLGIHPEDKIEEGITQVATKQIFKDGGGAYPLETEAAKRVMEEQGAGNVFYPNMISPSKRHEIVDSFRRHYNNLSGKVKGLFRHYDLSDLYSRLHEYRKREYGKRESRNRCDYSDSLIIRLSNYSLSKLC